MAEAKGLLPSVPRPSSRRGHDTKGCSLTYPREGLTAVTNAINIAMEVAGRDMRVIVTGCVLPSETYKLIGPFAEPGRCRSIWI